METDARGQLGGLDTTDEVRRRLARESRSFKCSTCARSNIDIISESEEQATKPLASTNPIVQIPSELSMAWKDELTAKGQASGGGSLPVGQAEASQDDIDENAELAEGFVRTGFVDQQTSENATTDASPSSSGRLGGRLTEVENTRGRESTPQQQIIPRRPVTQRPQGDGGIPLWIDRAIVALVIALVALLLKVLFGI